MYTEASKSAFPEGLNFVSAFNVEKSPVDDRKSGIPAATLMPAPAITIIRLAFASSFIVFLHSSDEDIPSIARSSTSYGRLESTIVVGAACVQRKGISTANGGGQTTIVDKVSEGGGLMTSMIGKMVSGSVLSFCAVGDGLEDIHAAKVEQMAGIIYYGRDQNRVTCLKFSSP